MEEACDTPEHPCLFYTMHYDNSCCQQNKLEDGENKNLENPNLVWHFTA